MTDPYASALQTIAHLLAEEEGWWTIVDENPDSYGRLITDLALAIGDQQIIYLDSTVEYEPVSASVVVYTESLLVRASFSPDPQVHDRATVKVTSYPRRGLLSVSTAGRVPATGRDTRREWPGPVKVSASYEGELTLKFPMSAIRHEAKKAGLFALISSLRSELSR